MKLFKRLGALALCVVLVIGCFAGCHGKNATVATATADDGSEITVPAGVYLIMLLNADMEARNLVTSQLGSASSSTEINFARQKITATDGTEYKFYDYVEKRAKEYCQAYVGTHYLFLKNGCTLTAEEEEMANFYAQHQWSYGDNYLYGPNDISFESYAQYLRVVSYERSHLFDYYYDNGGEKEPSREVIEEGLNEHFVLANVIEISTKDSDGKALSDEEKAEIKALLQSYADEINSAENIEDGIKSVYDKYEEYKAAKEAEEKAEESDEGATSSEDTSSDTASTDTTSSEDTSSTSSEDTSSAETSSDAEDADEDSKYEPTMFYSSDAADIVGQSSVSWFADLKALDETSEDATVLEGTDGYYRMVVRRNILSDEENYTEYKNSVLRILYAEEFEEFVEAETGSIEVDYNKYELDYLKPKNFDYTDYQAYQLQQNQYNYY